MVRSLINGDNKKVLGKHKKIRGIFGLWLWEDPQDINLVRPNYDICFIQQIFIYLLIPPNLGYPS